MPFKLPGAVKPRTGLSIRDPFHRDLLPETGRIVPDTLYWQCLLRDKDVEPTVLPIEPEPASPAAAPARRKAKES